MRKKRIITLLLAVLLCIQLLPTTALAATTPNKDQYAICLNLEGVVGGTATLTAGTTTIGSEFYVGTKIASAFDLEAALHAVATPDDGYEFSGWKIKKKTSETADWKNAYETNTKFIVFPSATDSLLAEDICFCIKTKNFYQLTPSFSKRIKVTLASSDTSNGSVSCTTEGAALDAFLPGTPLTLQATPIGDCTLLKWAVTYTDGSELPSDAYKLEEDLKDANKAKLTLESTVTKDITVTATFTNATEPNFVLLGRTPGAEFYDSEGNDSCIGTVTGWSNDLNEKIVITFTETDKTIENAKTAIIYKSALGSQLIPENVTFTISGSNGEAGNRKNALCWSWDGLSSSYEVPFTVSDGRGHTKNGVIRYELKNRALVQITTSANIAQKDTAITYNETEYKHGAYIDLSSENGKITLSAPETSGTFGFQKWQIDGVTLDNPTANPVTFALPNRFITIQATYSVIRTLSINNEEGAHGTAKIVLGDEQVDSVELVQGGKKVKVVATADEGYEFVKWDVKAYINRWLNAGTFVKVQNWTTITDEKDLYDPNLTIGLKGYNIQLTPVFDTIAQELTVTIDHSNNSEGTVLPADTTVQMKPNRQPLTLTATPAANYHFDKWVVTETESGNAASEADYTLTENESEAETRTATFSLTASATKPLTIKAQFKAFVPVTATIEAKNTTIGWNGTTYKNGDTITFLDNQAVVSLTATPDTGYRFYVWKSDVTLELQPGSSLAYEKLSLKLPSSDFTLKASSEKAITSYQVFDEEKDITNLDEAWRFSSSATVTPVLFWSYSATTTFDEAVVDRSKRVIFNCPSAVPAETKVLISVDQVLGVKSQYLFDSIQVNGATITDEKTFNGTHYCAFIMQEQDVSVVVNVHSKANVQITAAPDDATHGSVALTPTGSGDGSYYQEGTLVSLSATASDGYRFKEWQEASGSTYISTENKTKSSVQFEVGKVGATITAVFEQAEKVDVPLTYAVTPSGKATIQVNGGDTVASTKEGTSISLSVTDIDEYYLFDHWEIKNSKGESLILQAEQANSNIQITIPNDADGVTITAILKERTIPLSRTVYLNYAGDDTISKLGTFYISVNGEPVTFPTSVKKGDRIEYRFELTDAETYVLDEVLFVVPGSPWYELTSISDYSGAYTVTDWKANGNDISAIAIYANITTKSDSTTRYNITLTQPSSGGTIQSSNQTAMANTTVTLTAVPATGYALKAWTVKNGDTAITVTADASNKNQATFTMPAANVTVTAEFEKKQVVAPEITAVQLLSNSDKSVLASGELDTASSTWTITLPADTDQDILDDLRMQYLKITHTGASVAMQGGTDDALTDYKWADGTIMCNMRLNVESTFTVTAEDGTTKKVYKIKIVQETAQESGQYTITYNGPAGGTIIPSKSKANAGETITLTIQPDSGKQMVEGTLQYAYVDSVGTVSITGTSFVMPASNITLSCNWKDAESTGGDSPSTTVDGITSFSIDGVQGVVDNTANTISVVMPYGTDVTQLIPTISGNNISSISPASGKMVNFTKPVIYTVTLADGSTKQYTVTVYVQKGTAADEMWDKLTDFYNQTPWWEYADNQISTGHYPQYW